MRRPHNKVERAKHLRRKFDIGLVDGNALH